MIFLFYFIEFNFDESYIFYVEFYKEVLDERMGL